MSKLSTIKQFKKDGSKFINGYRITLQKSKIEAMGWNENTEMEINYNIDKKQIEIKESQ